MKLYTIKRKRLSTPACRSRPPHHCYYGTLRKYAWARMSFIDDRELPLVRLPRAQMRMLLSQFLSKEGSRYDFKIEVAA